jgi:hypothetical protein
MVMLLSISACGWDPEAGVSAVRPLALGYCSLAQLHLSDVVPSGITRRR